MEQIILDKVLLSLNNKRETPLLVAIHAPQGCGKSTTCSNIQNILHNRGYDCLIASLDDFYYSYQKMQQILFEFRDDLYKYRGLAGTHDIQCLQEFLENVKQGKNALLPRFNKLLNNGLGDVDNVVQINKKYDVVILEGWMIGYKPRQYIPSYLRTFNRELEKYQFLHTMFDLWFYFDTDLQHIYHWRYSAEKKMNKEKFDQFMKPYFIIYSNYLINNSENKYYLDKNRNIINNPI